MRVKPERENSLMLTEMYIMLYNGNGRRIKGLTSSVLVVY